MDVPAPRAVIGTPVVAQASTTAITSSTWRGRTTTRGTTRYSEASVL
jgi:hypothetical protein